MFYHFDSSRRCGHERRTLYNPPPHTGRNHTALHTFTPTSWILPNGTGSLKAGKDNMQAHPRQHLPHRLCLSPRTPFQVYGRRRRKTPLSLCLFRRFRRSTTKQLGIQHKGNEKRSNLLIHPSSCVGVREDTVNVPHVHTSNPNLPHPFKQPPHLLNAPTQLPGRINHFSSSALFLRFAFLPIFIFMPSNNFDKHPPKMVPHPLLNNITSQNLNQIILPLPIRHFICIPPFIQPSASLIQTHRSKPNFILNLGLTITLHFPPRIIPNRPSLHTRQPSQNAVRTIQRNGGTNKTVQQHIARSVTIDLEPLKKRQRASPACKPMVETDKFEPKHTTYLIELSPSQIRSNHCPSPIYLYHSSPSDYSNATPNPASRS